MSLSFFSVRNQWHKNGKTEATQASGGSLRSPTASWASRPMTPSGFKDASFLTNFTISDNKCCIEPTLKAQMSPT